MTKRNYDWSFFPKYFFYYYITWNEAKREHGKTFLVLDRRDCYRKKLQATKRAHMGAE